MSSEKNIGRYTTAGGGWLVNKAVFFPLFVEKLAVKGESACHEENRASILMLTQADSITLAGPLHLPLLRLNTFPLITSHLCTA